MYLDPATAAELIHTLEAALAVADKHLDDRPPGYGRLAWAAELHNAALLARDVLRAAQPEPLLKGYVFILPGGGTIVRSWSE